MIELDRINDEVFVVRDTIVALGEEEFFFLKRQAEHSPRRRARICMHRDNNDSLHEMLIVMSAQSYIHPHKHLAKSESFHVVEGMADVVIFDDEGNVTNVVELGTSDSGRNYLYRLSDSRFHTLIVYSDILVIHEVTNGPFKREQTLLAPFAPNDCKKVDVQHYIQHLANEVTKFKRSRASDG